MKHRPYAFALIISLVFIVAAACQRDQSKSPNSSEMTLSIAAAASPTQDVVNSAFVVTADRVRKAFDDVELRGEKKQGISVGEEKAINLSAKDQLGKAETLKFSILFLTPLEQARAAGYSFGQNAKGKTAADRKDFEDRTISTVIANGNEVAFRVFLQQPKNEDVAIPSFAYRLIDKDGARVGPITEPSSLIALGKDLPGTVGLAQEGEKLTFPLFAGSVPNLTARMKKMTLIVEINGKEQGLEYALE